MSCELLGRLCDIAGTIAQSANRVFLNPDSLLLNLGDCKPMAGDGGEDRSEGMQQHQVAAAVAEWRRCDGQIWRWVSSLPELSPT